MTDITDVTDLPEAPAAEEARARPAYPTLPVVDDPELPVSRPKEVRRQARRHFLQMMGAVGAGVGLAFTDVLSNRFTRPAGAAAYEVWGDCRGYYSSTTTCVPSSAYYGSDNCTGNWHREGRIGIPGPTPPDLQFIEYTHLPTTCAGRNAWVWITGDVGTKCSDGRKMRWRAATGEIIYNYFSICRKPLL
jgi:hypothetical protein